MVAADLHTNAYCTPDGHCRAVDPDAHAGAATPSYCIHCYVPADGYADAHTRSGDGDPITPNCNGDGDAQVVRIRNAAPYAGSAGVAAAHHRRDAYSHVDRSADDRAFANIDSAGNLGLQNAGG
jgi:hypothetical protein